MGTIHYFDCNASFGMRCLRLPGSSYTKEDLLKKMDKYHIEKAMVYHNMAKEYDPLDGNQILMNEIKGHEDRLIPVWAVLPHYTGEFWHPQVLVQKMRESGVKAVTMFPFTQAYNVEDCTCGAIYETLEEYNIPLFLGYDQLCCYMPQFAKLVEAHPNMKVVLTNVNYRIDRDLYPLMEKYDNFYLETSGYKPFKGLTAFCRQFGAQRLLFGTGMPVISAPASIGIVSYADISDEEKQMIAAGNLENLLGGVRL